MKIPYLSILATVSLTKYVSEQLKLITFDRLTYIFIKASKISSPTEQLSTTNL